MYGTSEQFHTLVIDPEVEQEFLCIVGNDYFSTRNGDFTDEDITITEQICEGDITYGNASSASLSFSLNNEFGYIQAITWTEGACYIGVKTGENEYVFPEGVNCHIEVGGHTYDGKDDGVYQDGTLWIAMNAPCISLDVFGGYLYAYGDGDCRRANLADLTASPYGMDRFMANKWSEGVSAVFDDFTGTVWNGETVETFEYCPMGIFRLNKPARTAGEIVSISEAFDRMTYFDVDAGPWVADLPGEMTLGALFTSLCNYCGVGYKTATFTNSSVSILTNAIKDTAYSCRSILGFIAGRAFKNARIGRTGLVEFIDWGTTPAEILDNERVEMDGTDISEFVTQPITRVTLKSSEGSSLSDGEPGNEYVFCNPLFNSLDAQTTAAIKALPRYIPLMTNVLIADPSIDIGDMAELEPSITEQFFTDEFNRLLLTELGEALYENVPPTSFPIMQRVLTFAIGCSAEYTASGEKYREVDDMTRYNATVSISEKVDGMLTQDDIFNRLTDNGRMQGLYMSGNDLYINAEYIRTGYLSADRINAGTITLEKLATAVQTKVNKSLNATVTCYYRSTSSTAPDKPTATSGITNNYDTDNQWTYIMPYPKKSRYFYTCEQYTASDGTVSWSGVTAIRNANYTANWCREENATYIDGGAIYTHSITANQLAADSVTAEKIDVSDLNAIGATIGGFKIETNSIHTNGVAITSNATNSIGLSSANFNRTINGTSRALRFAIGSKFGVAGDGTAYMSNAVVSGAITATSLDVTNATITGLTVDESTISSLSASKISGGTLDASKMTVTNLSASSINSGTLSADRISGGTINASNVTITNLNASNITGGTLNINNLVSNRSISADKLVLTDVTIAAQKISQGALGGNITFALDSVNSATQNATSTSATLKIGSSFDIHATSSYMRFAIGGNYVEFYPSGPSFSGVTSFIVIHSGNYSYALGYRNGTLGLFDITT